MNSCQKVLLIFLILILSALPVYGEPLEIVTEEYPPYSYSDNGKIVGIATEIVEAVLNDLNIKTKIKIYPWARAYRMAQSKKNVLIFTIERTPARESLFKWVGVLVSSDQALFSLRKRDDIQINSLNDAKTYEIGAVLEDSGTQHLLSEGFTRIQQVSLEIQNLEKLLAKRIDLWLTSELNGYYMIEKNGYDTKNFEKKYAFQISSGAYIAFSKSTSDEVVETFRTALKKIKNTETYTEILKKYK